MSDLYAQDGVDVAEGDSFSAFAGKICRASYDNSPFVEVQDYSNGHFRGPRTFKIVGLPDGCEFDMAPDTVGTKTIVIDAANAHPTAGRNLLAMCAGDVTRWGGLPQVFVNALEVNTLGKDGSETNGKLRSLLRGLGEAAREQGIVLLKGETAEVGVCVGSENPDAVTKFNWSGTMFGVYHPDRMITGDTLDHHQAIVAFQDDFRSNAMSLARKALAIKFGKEWYRNPEAMEAIKAVATPSTLYDRFLAAANGWYGGERAKIHSIIHITGGGIKSKLGEDVLFPRGLSANLDDLWDPPAIMRDCAEWRGLDDEQFYSTLNGGQGVLVILDEGDHADRFVEEAVRCGIQARKCGYTLRSVYRERLCVTSKFTGREFSFVNSRIPPSS